MSKTELYIGNLNNEANQEELENVFKRYGKIKQCQIKNKGDGHVYAFIEFEDERDAEDALSEHGKDMCGASMVVKYTKGKDQNRERRGNDRYGGGGGDRRSGFRGGRGGRGNGGRDGGRPLECFQCGETGHFARDCRNPRREGGRGGGDRGGRRDFRGDRGRERFNGNRRDRSRSRSFDRSRNDN